MIVEFSRFYHVDKEFNSTLKRKTKDILRGIQHVLFCQTNDFNVQLNFSGLTTFCLLSYREWTFTVMTVSSCYSQTYTWGKKSAFLGNFIYKYKWKNISSCGIIKLHKIKPINHQYSIYIDYFEKENFLYIWQSYVQKQLP